MGGKVSKLVTKKFKNDWIERGFDFDDFDHVSRYTHVEWVSHSKLLKVKVWMKINWIWTYFKLVFIPVKPGMVLNICLQNSLKPFQNFSCKWDIFTNIPESPTYREIRITGTDFCSPWRSHLSGVNCNYKIKSFFL